MISFTFPIWRCAKAELFIAASLHEWMKKVPDPRSTRKKMYDSAEILTYIIMAYASGRTSLRRAIAWAENHLTELRKYMKLENGIASVSTIFRLFRDIDQNEFNNIMMQWIAQLLNQRKLIIAIDGKGLRGAADRIGDGRTPYILNAIDVETKLVIAQLPISTKDNEISGIPELLGILDLRGNLITIDAIGTQWRIMDIIPGEGGFYLLTVKENQSDLKNEISGYFRTVRKRMEQGLTDAEKEKYSIKQTAENNRSRIEHRKMETIQANPIGGREELAFDDIRTIGLHEQTRIPIRRDENGKDITQDYESFRSEAISRAKDKFKSKVMYDDEYLCEGMISNKHMNAEEMARIKRGHWTIENQLHHVLDDLFREDRSSARITKDNLALVRKIAFNLLVLASHHENSDRGPTAMMDIFADRPELLAKYTFKGISSF